MKSTVTYLMSGPGYLPYLITSLYTLRRYYHGPVQVEAYSDSHEIVKRIADDRRLRIEISDAPFPVAYRQKNSQFISKIRLCQRPDCDLRVYLDADTTIRGPIDELFTLGKTYGMCITQFNQWTSDSGLARARVERLLQFPTINPTAILETIGHPYPSPNGGVFAVTPQSPVLPVWHQYSWEARTIFICDEAVLHILPQIFPKHLLHVETTGRYNCSHKWKSQVTDPVIMHYHGNSCVRPDKSPAAVDEWWTLFGECVAQNLGFINEWKSSINNKWMHLLKRQKDFKYADLVP